MLYTQFANIQLVRLNFHSDYYTRFQRRIFMSTKITIQWKNTKHLKFYKNLPSKICVNCGYVIIEQHESYLTKCEHCLRKENE